MKTLLTLILLTLASLLVAQGTVFAQESNCTALLQHGIYDHVRETSSSASASQATSAFCDAYNSWHSSSSGGGGGLSIPGIGGLSGNYSHEQAEAIGSLVCSSTSSSTTGSAAAVLAQDKIDAAAVQAWQQCVALSTVGVRSKTEYREADQAQMTVELWYVQLPGSPATTRIDSITVSPANAMQCSGTLVSAAQSHANIGTSSVAMSCERSLLTTPTTWNGRQILAPPSSVVVMTRSGTLTRYFSPVFAAPPPTPLMLPVGTIVPFSGTIEQANALKGSGWWPCDGQTINDQLSPLNGQKTPDLSDDRFLVGAKTSGGTGGKNGITVPERTIKTKIDSFEGPNVFLPPPMTIIPETWRNGGQIVAHGTIPAMEVSAMPLFYKVIYLMKVK